MALGITSYFVLDDRNVERGMVRIDIWHEWLWLPLGQELLFLLLRQPLRLELSLPVGHAPDEQPHNPRDEKRLQDKVIARDL